MADTARAIHYPFPDPPAPGDAIEVAPGILWLRLPLPMALDHVNVYALDEGDAWTIVDTGIDTKRSRAIWEKALSGPLAGKPVTRVVVTHHHPDHIGLAGWFQTAQGAELLTTRTAWLFARMLTLDEQATPTPETADFWRSAGMDADILAERLTERPFNFADMVARMPLGFTRLKDEDRVTLGGRKWTVLFGSGHAPDHATFWAQDGKIVLGGDQLIPSISPNLGVYATEPEADPVADWLVSCKRFQTIADPHQLVLPGHKLPFTGLPSRLDQLIENHTSALRRLEAHLTTPRTAVECFLPLFKREIVKSEYGLAMVEAMAHCLHLWHQGRATRRRRDDGAWLWQTKGSG
jgi:glyoxylase-like metal-dependent hydrolase (beta-lactamase superfamily II)